MNKAELIATVAEKTGLSKKDSEKAVNATFDTITANLEVGEKVQLVGFGVFDIKERGARIGRNPKTKEEIEIPATRVPVFKAGSRTRVPNKNGVKRSGMTGAFLSGGALCVWINT